MTTTVLNYCNVQNCRYSQLHTTVAHRCGSCQQYGHGRLECNNQQLKDTLRQYIGDQMPNDLWCTYGACSYPWSHSVESHHCYICGERTSHSASSCPTRMSASYSHHSENEATRQGCITKTCPLCRVYSDINITFTVFTDAPCVICLADGPKVIFSGCTHAVICRDCVLKL